MFEGEGLAGSFGILGTQAKSLLIMASANPE